MTTMQVEMLVRRHLDNGPHPHHWRSCWWQQQEERVGLISDVNHASRSSGPDHDQLYHYDHHIGAHNDDHHVAAAHDDHVSTATPDHDHTGACSASRGGGSCGLLSDD